MGGRQNTPREDLVHPDPRRFIDYVLHAVIKAWFSIAPQASISRNDTGPPSTYTRAPSNTHPTRLRASSLINELLYTHVFPAAIDVYFRGSMCSTYQAASPTIVHEHVLKKAEKESVMAMKLRKQNVQSKNTRADANAGT